MGWRAMFRSQSGYSFINYINKKIIKIISNFLLFSNENTITVNINVVHVWFPSHNFIQWFPYFLAVVFSITELLLIIIFFYVLVQLVTMFLNLQYFSLSFRQPDWIATFLALSRWVIKAFSSLLNHRALLCLAVCFLKGACLSATLVSFSINVLSEISGSFSKQTSDPCSSLMSFT